ncbi:hypothetical protein N8772_02880 [Rickettsiales bacterium]|nr:hypothetical protein [Rickettsiales bacterium]MDB2550670.1 hypothetical protein [Rickettsiales bacterium]
MNPTEVNEIVINNLLIPLFSIASILLIIKLVRGFTVLFGDDYIKNKAKILLTLASICNFIAFISIFQILFMLYHEYLTRIEMGWANIISLIFIILSLIIFFIFIALSSYHIIKKKFYNKKSK